MNKEILNKFSNFLVKVIAVIFIVLMGINSLLVLTKTAIFPKDYQETLYYENVSAILNIMSVSYTHLTLPTSDLV